MVLASIPALPTQPAHPHAAASALPPAVAQSREQPWRGAGRNTSWPASLQRSQEEGAGAGETRNSPPSPSIGPTGHVIPVCTLVRSHRPECRAERFDQSSGRTGFLSDKICEFSDPFSQFFYLFFPKVLLKNARRKLQPKRNFIQRIYEQLKKRRQ